jgi:phosphatidylglycerophosphate synthase
MADLTEKDLENMKNHKYSSTGYSSLDNKMNPFWTKCASYLPYAYSPNMVTVTGLFCQLSSILLISLYDLTFSERLPTYVYFFCAFMLFMAQTLDAIDGKHARNTKRQSSLGQLMDHGCDSMDNFLFSIVLTQAFLFGNTIHSLVVQIVIQIPFYIFTLEEHVTGKIRTQFYNIGVTEYQFFSMGLLILSGIFGEPLVFLEIFGIRLSYITLYTICFSASIQAIHLIMLNSNSISDAFKKFNPMIIIISLCIAEFFCYKLYFYQKRPLLIILLNGLYYSLLTCKLIISNMAKKKIVILDIDLIIYIIGICTCIFIGNELIEFKIIIGLYVWLAYRYYKQIIYSIFKMLEYLKISF